MNHALVVAPPSALVSRLGLLSLYFVSGAVALVYQVLWARWLATVFGVSIFGVAVTTIAFMLGLGAGSIVAQRRVGGIAKPLFLFGVIEIAIAFFALLLPPIQSSLDAGLFQLTSGGSVGLWHGAQAIAAVLVLSVPTFGMGFVFPMVVSAARSVELPLADVYGANTVGAALGALVPLVLLPGLGWTVSVIGTAGAGVCIGIGALALSRRIDRPEQRAASANGATNSDSHPAIGTLIAYGCIGCAALVLEVAWVRLYGMVLLRTEYVLAVILSVYLIGIGLGSFLARRPWVERWGVIFPLIASSFALLSLWVLPAVGTWADGAEFQTLDGALMAQGGLLMLVTLPVTLVLGAWLPLLVRRSGDSPRAAAQLYGANCLGGALGAAVTAFALLPGVGSAASIVIASLILFAAGMYWVDDRRLWLGAVPLVAIAVPVVSLPAAAKLLPHTLAGTEQRWVNEDAIAVTHVVEQADGQRLLLSDLQRMDASTAPSAVTSQRNQVRLPLLLHPQPRDVLLLGLGTGISASAALDFDGLNITAVELAAGAIEAAGTYFATSNRGVMEKAEIVRDDARRFLKSDAGRFDVIVGDLFHPDLVGRSTLLSVQQFERARDHLNENGVFAQWLAVNQFDVKSLEIVLRSFAQAFPRNALFVDGFRLAMVGTNGADVDWGRAMQGALSRMSTEQIAGATGGEGPWTWLGRYWGTIVTDSGPIQDEWWPQVEYRLPAARYGGAIDVKSVLDFLLKQRPLLRNVVEEFDLPEAAREPFERAFIGTDLAVRSWHMRLSGRQGEALRLLRLAYEANPADQWISYQLADEMLLSVVSETGPDIGRLDAIEAILKVAPEHPEVLEALWRTLEGLGRSEPAAEVLQRLQRIDPLRRLTPESPGGKSAEG